MPPMQTQSYLTFVGLLLRMVDGKEYDGQVEDLLATEDLNLGSLEIGQSGGIVTPL